MPFTPFHLGPALFFGLLLTRYLHFRTFLIANLIVDIEPFLVLLLGLNYPLHGFFHSFVGGSLMAIFLTISMRKLDRERSSSKCIWSASLSGIYLHILFDSPLYTDIRPFYPYDYNPFYNNGVIAGFDIYLLCVLLFVAGVLIYWYRSGRSTSLPISSR